MKKGNDLDALFPEIREETKFTAGDGKQYKINFFIPAGVEILSMQENKDAEHRFKILEAFLIHQHGHMTIEWIKENLSIQMQNYISLKIAQYNCRSVAIMGEGWESAMPGKKPEKMSFWKRIIMSGQK